MSFSDEELYGAWTRHGKFVFDREVFQWAFESTSAPKQPSDRMMCYNACVELKKAGVKLAWISTKPGYISVVGQRPGETARLGPVRDNKLDAFIAFCRLATT